MQEKLRKLPKIDTLLLLPVVQEKIGERGRQVVLHAVRKAIDSLREDLLSGRDYQNLKTEAISRIDAELARMQDMNFRRIINATGIVLHTNMGRALLSERAKEAVWEAAGSYSNLELDLSTGKRGSRYDHVIELIKILTGCEDAMVVNNNAAAVLLALDTLAKGGETLLSRGEMVEIGGSFRVPEVMKLGGTTLVEVGTTNRTHLFDYENAITEETKVILKVHTSNYRILGFSQGVERGDLMSLAQKHHLVVFEDLGSGFLANLDDLQITDEPRVQDVVVSGIDVVSFSGDKLLGGPQAGILVGKKCYIERMKKNQLNRALRIDKLTISALEATLRDYLDEEHVRSANPTLRMLVASPMSLKEKALILQEKLREKLGMVFPLEEDESPAGGGSLPGVMLPTWVIRLSWPGLDEERLTHILRSQRPAVMARKNKKNLVLDVRTVAEEEMEELAGCIASAYHEEIEDRS